MATRPTTRSYRSPLRAQQAEATRAAILRSAATAFDESGWQVGVREIARAAGCSVETIYSTFGSKLGLLLRVIDVAVVQDDEDVPLADREVFREFGVGTTDQRIETACGFAIGMHRRTAGPMRALFQAALDNPEAAREVAVARGRISTSQRAILGMVLGREPSDDQALDLAVVASVDTFLFLTRDLGLDDEAYTSWLRRHLHLICERTRSPS